MTVTLAGAVPELGVTCNQFPPEAVATLVEKASAPLLGLLMESTCVGAGSPWMAVKRRNWLETAGRATAFSPSVSVTGMAAGDPRAPGEAIVIVPW